MWANICIVEKQAHKRWYKKKIGRWSTLIVGGEEGGLVVAAPPPTSEAPEATSRAAPLLIGTETAPAAGSEPAAARREAAVHDDRDLWRFDPSCPRDLRLGPLSCRGDFLTLPLFAAADAAGLVEDSIDDGLVPAV